MALWQQRPSSAALWLLAGRQHCVTLSNSNRRAIDDVLTGSISTGLKPSARAATATPRRFIGALDTIKATIVSEPNGDKKQVETSETPEIGGDYQ